MRLWHYKLIPYLPLQQLVSQWRECICIAKNIAEKGTPNHILVNKIMNYPIEEFHTYCNLVLGEMVKRGYRIRESSLVKLEKYIQFNVNVSPKNYDKNLFVNWHNMNYLDVCYMNLYEKYWCGGIDELQWKDLVFGYKKVINH